MNEPVDAYLAAEPPSPVRGLLSKEEEEKAKDKLQVSQQPFVTLFILFYSRWLQMALNATNVKEMAKELQEEKKTETVATWRYDPAIHVKCCLLCLPPTLHQHDESDVFLTVVLQFLFLFAIFFHSFSRLHHVLLCNFLPCSLTDFLV